MITLEDVKYELFIDLNDNSRDREINRVIERSQNYLKSYCNNPNLDFTKSDLDEVVLYLTCKNLNRETRFGTSAGKDTENMGFHIAFSTDLPSFLKDSLLPYTRVSFI